MIRVPSWLSAVVAVFIGHRATDLTLFCRKKTLKTLLKKAKTRLKPRVGECEKRWRLSAQQFEHALRHLVGLRHHGHTGLLQDLRLAQLSGFLRKVGILNPASRSGQVLRGGLKVFDGGLEAVLNGAQIGPSAVDQCQGLIDDVDGIVGAGAGADVNTCN